MRRSQAPSQVQPNVGTPTTPRFNSPFKLGKPKSLPATLSTTPSKPSRLVVSRAVKQITPKRKQISSSSQSSCEGGSEEESTLDQRCPSDFEVEEDGEQTVNGKRKKVRSTVETPRTPLSFKAVGNEHNRDTPTPRSAGSSVLCKAFRVPTMKNGNPSMDPSQRLRPLTLGVRRRPAVMCRPLHDPEEEGALILYVPPVLSLTEQLEQLKSHTKTEEPESKTSSAKQPPLRVHVVVDPKLTKVLRPHQVEGVRFLYECVTGQRVEDAYGCIMADEMGLGKTLQCITLLWTLIRQSPDAGKPTIDKCIIVCPSSLVRNWANELVKWLGPNSISPLACDGKGTKEKITQELQKFVSGRGRMNVYPVLIISYETLRINAPLLQKTPIGLLLCDEGHRLKNSNSLTFQALNLLQVQRRVILSGTPIQNDLSEYFSLLNFANPGLLGSPAEFRKNYENPILRGRDAMATQQERDVSDLKLTELYSIANKFIIRRTNDLLSKYLPVKYEHIVFCKLSTLQLDLYNLFVNSKSVKKLLSGSGSQPLKAITMLKKLCNHPGLLNLPKDLEGSQEILPHNYSNQTVDAQLSGKMLVLERMLINIKSKTDDKIVLISNYTQTLDIFEKMCRSRSFQFLRLDGSMTISKRQQLVDKFNNPQGPEFVFLLSSKAGGCGLNLIGANRLVLFDPDWNPASDQQALARVWRDGQKKDCFIYRFIATGSIEEKIFQRQSHKQSLSSCVVDEEENVQRHFSSENLRQLFKLNGETMSETHDTYKCRRCLKGRQHQNATEPMSYGDSSSWDHFSELEWMKVYDTILREAGKGTASYAFQYKSQRLGS